MKLVRYRSPIRNDIQIIFIFPINSNDQIKFDPRNEQILLNSLSTSYQLPNQNYERLQRLKENVQINNPDENTVRIKNEMFDEQSRCTFFAGLKELHRSYVLH